jgi:lipoyl(octanoyl) transferase
LARRQFYGRYLGRSKYEPVLTLQRELFAARQRGDLQDTVLFVEHEPVITLGRGTISDSDHLLASEATLQALGVDLVDVERGGDVTLHAPGQLVCYPIIDLKPDRCDVRRYVNDLAEAMRRVLADFNLDAGLAEGMVGLWLDRHSPKCWPGQQAAKDMAKIGAIGVRLSRWTTMHGYALNLSTNLQYFNLIVPCGIRDFPVTSVEQVSGECPAVGDVVARAFQHLADVFEADAVELNIDKPLE